MIGIDTEFRPCDSLSSLWTKPTSADEAYAQMRTSVDGGNLIQVGLALAYANCSSIYRKVYQFNLRFDARTTSENREKVGFLRRSSSDLIAHGIPLEKFINKL